MCSSEAIVAVTCFNQPMKYGGMSLPRMMFVLCCYHPHLSKDECILDSSVCRLYALCMEVRKYFNLVPTSCSARVGSLHYFESCIRGNARFNMIDGRFIFLDLDWGNPLPKGRRHP